MKAPKPPDLSNRKIIEQQMTNGGESPLYCSSWNGNKIEIHPCYDSKEWLKAETYNGPTRPSFKQNNMLHAPSGV